MVQIYRSLFVLTTFAVSCLSAATVSGVASSLQALIATAVSLEATFQGLSSYNWLVSGPALHTGVISLVAEIIQCTTDVQALPQPLSVADTTILIEAVIPLEGFASGFLYTLLSRKDGLTKIPLVGNFSAQIVLVELNTIETPLLKLGEALVAGAHVSLTDKADAIKANITASLAAAIKAYSIY